MTRRRVCHPCGREFRTADEERRHLQAAHASRVLGPVDDRRVRRPNATEADLLAYVRDAAAWGGWLCYHTHDSRRSPEGFPDIVAVHQGLRRLVMAELKAARGKATPAQEQWLHQLQRVCAPHPYRHLRSEPAQPEVYLWRPADADTILQVFLGHRLSAHQPDRDSSLDRDATTPGGPD